MNNRGGTSGCRFYKNGQHGRGLGATPKPYTMAHVTRHTAHICSVTPRFLTSRPSVQDTVCVRYLVEGTNRSSRRRNANNEASSHFWLETWQGSGLSRSAFRGRKGVGGSAAVGRETSHVRTHAHTHAKNSRLHTCCTTRTGYPITSRAEYARSFQLVSLPHLDRGPVD